MRRGSISEAEIVRRPYGVMKMLAGGKKLKTTNVDLRILEIRAQESTTRHYHQHSESIFYVMEGTLEMELGEGGEAKVPLQVGDVVLIEPTEVHLLHNIGDRTAIVIEAMGPPFSTRDIFYFHGDVDVLAE